MNPVLAICVGACAGALARWQLALSFNGAGWLPWGTLAANWIGAYAVGLAVVFFQSAAKFKARYSTLGFNDGANLDEGDMWPTSYALTTIGPAEEKKIAELVRRAVG